MTVSGIEMSQTGVRGVILQFQITKSATLLPQIDLSTPFSAKKFQSNSVLQIYLLTVGGPIKLRVLFSEF